MISISIILITKNNNKELKLTINSLEQQEISKNCEILIINGGEKISFKKLSILKKKYKLKIIKDKGEGIYPAMNIATQFAKGNHLLFLNAGDKISGSNVLSNLLSLNFKKNFNYFFLCRVVGKYRKWIIPSHNTLIDTGKRRVPVHQGILFCKKFYKKNTYDEKMHIASDYAVKYIMLKERNFKFIPYLISEHYLGGISSNYKAKNYITTAVEIFKIDLKYKRILVLFTNQFLLFLKFIIHNALSGLLLEKILSKYHSLKSYEFKT